MNQLRFTFSGWMLAVGIACTLGGAAAAGPGADQDWAGSSVQRAKKNLAASYKPAIVSGQPWFRGLEAARLKNGRLARRAGEAARPIVLLRILGDLDGGT